MNNKNGQLNIQRNDETEGNINTHNDKETIKVMNSNEGISPTDINSKNARKLIKLLPKLKVNSRKRVILEEKRLKLIQEIKK